MAKKFIFLVVGLVLVGAFFTPGVTHAASNSLQFIPEVPFFGFSGAQEVNNDLLPRYIRTVYTYFVSIVGILATVMLIYGGIKWVAAAGNPGRINDARDTINNAIIGVIIALTSVVLLNLISPQFTTIGIPDIANVKSQTLGDVSVKTADGSCKPSNEIPCGYSCYSTTTGGFTYGDCSYCDSTKVKKSDNQCGFSLKSSDILAKDGNCQYVRCSDNSQVCSQRVTTTLESFVCSTTTNLGGLTQAGYTAGSTEYTNDYNCGEIWWEPACTNPVLCLVSGTHQERLRVGQKCFNKTYCLINEAKGITLSVRKSQITDLTQKTKIGYFKQSGCH